MHRRCDRGTKRSFPSRGRLRSMVRCDRGRTGIERTAVPQSRRRVVFGPVFSRRNRPRRPRRVPIGRRPGCRRRPWRAVVTVLVGLLGGVVLGAVGAVVPGGGPAWAAVPQIAPHVYQGGGVIGFGDAESINAPVGATLSSVMVAMTPDPAATTGSQGYWMAAADGGVFAQGSAPFYGSLGALHLNGPVVGMAATPDGRGYWLVALDGGMFTFGDAGFYGSMGGSHLNKPVVGMAPTPDGRGYWLVAQDGGHLHLRGRRVLRLHGRRSAQRPDHRHGRHRHRPRLLDGGGRRRASSPSGTPPSRLDWAVRRSMTRWWTW